MFVAKIDTMSFRIRLYQLDSIDSINVETLKHGLFKPTLEQIKRYRAVTGRSYKKVERASSVFLIEHERGITFTGLRWNNRNYVEIAVHGLVQYDESGNLLEGSIQKRLALIDMLKQLKEFTIGRVDYAIDKPKIPPRIIRKLLSKRQANPYKNSIYFEPKNQRERENPTLKIVLYDKGKKHNLSFNMERLELAIKSKYWSNKTVTIQTVNEIIKSKGIGIIKRWTGEHVEVESIF